MFCLQDAPLLEGRMTLCVNEIAEAMDDSDYTVGVGWGGARKVTTGIVQH